MTRTASHPAAAAMLALALVVAGCASRSTDVRAVPADPTQFARWSCTRIDDESERVQRRAAEVAYAVDQRSGNNIVALGVGLAVFWPALLALRPDGLEAEELAQLKGRHEALVQAAAVKRCPPASRALPVERAAALPVAPGERLVYEERPDARRPGTESALVVTELRRGGVEYHTVPGHGTLVHDAAGNVVSAPDGELAWPRLLRSEMALGQVAAGEILVVGDPLTRARVRGQVVALGPQTIAGRRFEVMVVELFGDAQRGDSYTRLDGAMVVDRASGVLLRLDLRSAQPPFALQRRLLRVDARP